MLGYATTTLLAGLLKVALLAAIAYMAATAHRARKEGVEWTPKTTKQRRIAWVVLIVAFFILFN